MESLSDKGISDIIKVGGRWYCVGRTAGVRVDKVPRWLLAGAAYLRSGLSLGPVQTRPGLAEQGGRAPEGRTLSP